MRKYPLVNGHYYHIISRSIAKFEIFRAQTDCRRLMQILDLYRYSDFGYKFSNFLVLNKNIQQDYIESIKDGPKSVEIVAYCLMPTHIHLILQQNNDNGITKYLTKTLNGFTRFFNLRHHRKGPLWESHFKSILVNTDEQLLHLTRYIHLNPTSAGLVKKPEEWQFSSYNEYLGKISNCLCWWQDVINLDPKKYKKFINSRISYQKELSKIKSLLIEDYTG
jgi:putative transposase